MFRVLGHGPINIGTVGTDQHPIKVTLLQAERQYRLTCRCGWSETAVTRTHAQMLSNRHAPDRTREQ